MPPGPRSEPNHSPANDASDSIASATWLPPLTRSHASSANTPSTTSSPRLTIHPRRHPADQLLPRRHRHHVAAEAAASHWGTYISLR